MVPTTALDGALEANSIMTTTLRLLRLGTCVGCVALAIACGGDDETAVNVSGGGQGGAGGGGQGGEGASGGSGASSGAQGGVGATPSTGGQGGAPATCDLTPCQIQGVTACCVNATTCGVDLLGTCTDPSSLPVQDAGALLPTETIVDDPACPDFTFDAFGMAIQLDGCCDATGVCGSSTANVSFPGFPIPTSCVTPDEAAALGAGAGIGGGDAGAPVPCNYPGASDDAGPTGQEDASTQGADASTADPDAGNNTGSPADAGGD